MNIFGHIKKNIYPLVLIILFLFIFFYRLDYNTLQSWDEAWYGSIAKEIVKTGDFMKMIWNGKPYYDHPPMGFWLIAISYKIFAINEFSTRFPAAILGLLSVLLIYKTGRELSGKREIGFAAALILGTSVWYVLRVRSGNLESPFVFFYILTIYLSLRSAKNFAWFPLTMLSFASLILTKTLVGVSAIVPLLYLNVSQLIKIRKNFVWIILGVALFGLLVVPWYRLHLATYPDFYEYHFIHKGTRNKTLESYFKLMPDLPLFYIHMGMRKWYRLWQASLFLSFFYIFIKSISFFIKKKRESLKSTYKYLFLFIWSSAVLYPFLTSEKTELWHLIPTYLPIALLIAVSFYDVGIFFVRLVKPIYLRIFFNLAFLTLFLYFSAVQIMNFRREVYPEAKYITDQVDIAGRLVKYKAKIYLDIDYLPVAVFYSGKRIDTLIYESDGEKTFSKLFEIDDGAVIGVTKNWVIDDLKKKNFSFRLLERNNTYSIIKKLL